MRNLRYILLILTLCPLLSWAQRRFSTSEQHEYGLAEKSGFSTKDVENKTDAIFGLHASLYTGAHHLIGLSAEGSWSSFINTVPTAANTPGGGSGGLHLLYEFQYSGFMLQTGVGLNYQRVFTDIADTCLYHAGLIHAGSMGKTRTFTLRHSFTERQDMAQHLYAQLPLYLGHYFFSSGSIWYLLAGVHVNYAFWGNTKQTLTGSTSGLYDDLVGVWDEMDNHGFRRNVPIERTGGKLDMKLDVLAHAEVGYEYNTQQGAKDYRTRPGDRVDCRLRFAAFADFGILNTMPTGKGVFYGVPEPASPSDGRIFDFPLYEMDYVFATKDAASFWMRNLYAGVRFTVLLGFKPEERCILCDPWRH